MTIQERVAAGVAWLDAEYPGWEMNIDQGRFDFRACSRCVLGQVANDFWNIVSSGTMLYCEGQKLLFSEAINMGFTVSDNPPRSVQNDEWDSLGEEWIRVIKERQEHDPG